MTTTPATENGLIEGLCRAICEAKGYDPDAPAGEYRVQWECFKELARSTVATHTGAPDAEDRSEGERNFIQCGDCGRTHDRRQACAVTAIGDTDPKPGQHFMWGEDEVTVIAVIRGVGEAIKFRRLRDGQVLQCGLDCFRRMSALSPPAGSMK